MLFGTGWNNIVNQNRINNENKFLVLPKDFFLCLGFLVF